MEGESEVCKDNKMILNVTTNGRLLMELNDRQLEEAVKGITMISLSYDDYKIANLKDLAEYVRLVERLNKV